MGGCLGTKSAARKPYAAKKSKKKGGLSEFDRAIGAILAKDSGGSATLATAAPSGAKQKPSVGGCDCMPSEPQSHVAPTVKHANKKTEFDDPSGRAPPFTNGTGKHSLQLSAGDGDLASVQELLAQGHSVNEVLDGDGGNTPLHHAAQRGRYNVCEELLAAKADLNVRNNCLLTPVEVAIEWSPDPEIAKLLRAHAEAYHTRAKLAGGKFLVSGLGQYETGSPWMGMDMDMVGYGYADTAFAGE